MKKLIKHKISVETWAIMLVSALVVEVLLILYLKAETTCTADGMLCQTAGIVYKP